MVISKSVKIKKITAHLYKDSISIILHFFVVDNIYVYTLHKAHNNKYMYEEQV